MYVHIGKDTIIPSKEIITIIDLEKMLINKSMEEIEKELNIENKITDISEGNKKTLLLIENNKKTKGYISNISSITLAKRLQQEIV